MKEQLITFQTAKLAKEKGFNIQCKYFYNEGSNFQLQDDYILRLGNDIFYEAPSQSELQTWLRDDEKIMVWLEPVGKDNHDSILWTWKLIDWSKNNDTVDGNVRLSYEDALEAGLVEALHLING